MSRTGKQPVIVPQGVTVAVNGQSVEVKGPKGTRRFTAGDAVTIALEDSRITVKPRNLDKYSRQQWGLTRSCIQNLVTGVTTGFRKELEIQGVGYRAAMQGDVLKLTLGFSHDVDFKAPSDVTLSSPKATEIVVEGIDEQRVGQVAANIREWRRPEPYGGKGIRYKGEFVFRKAGKKK